MIPYPLCSIFNINGMEYLVDYIKPVFFLFHLLILSLYDVHSNEWSSSLLSLLIMHSVHCQAESQQTLRDLRLQFAEQISLLATKKKGSDVIETLFRGACACVWVQNLTPKHVPAFILFFLFFCFDPLRQQDWVSDPEGRSGPEFSVSQGWRRTLPWRFSRVHNSTRKSRFSFFFSNFFIPFILYSPFWSCMWPLDATERRSKIFTD